MSNIKIYGRLENVTTNNQLAGASLIFDDKLNKFQSLINLEVIFETEKGEANGVATLNSSRKIPAAQLPSYVDDVVEYNSRTNFPNPGEEGKIYVAKDNNNTYRWSGSLYILVGTPLELGETSTTAYAGDKGKAVTDRVDSHISNTSNPHNVTKEQVGLGNVNNTSDTNKPVSTAQSEAINTAKSEAITTVGNYTINGKKINTNPTLSKTDVGLNNVDNTTDVNKPISTALQLALNSKVDKVDGKSLVSDTEITKLAGLKSQTEINSDITDVLSTINSHISNTSNPHNVTKELVGLSNVDNTADNDKPISTAVLEALNTKANVSDLNNKITSNTATSIITLTKAEYQNLETKDNQTIYLIVDSVLMLEDGTFILTE